MGECGLHGCGSYVPRWVGVAYMGGCGSHEGEVGDFGEDTVRGGGGLAIGDSLLGGVVTLVVTVGGAGGGGGKVGRGRSKGRDG